MQGLLVQICMALLEKLIIRGTSAFTKYLALKEELAMNAKKSAAYEKVVLDPNATREDRRKAEDEALG